MGDVPVVLTPRPCCDVFFRDGWDTLRFFSMYEFLSATFSLGGGLIRDGMLNRDLDFEVVFFTLFQHFEQ